VNARRSTTVGLFIVRHQCPLGASLGGISKKQQYPTGDNAIKTTRHEREHTHKQSITSRARHSARAARPRGELPRTHEQRPEKPGRSVQRRTRLGVRPRLQNARAGMPFDATPNTRKHKANSKGNRYRDEHFGVSPRLLNDNSAHGGERYRGDPFRMGAQDF